VQPGGIVANGYQQGGDRMRTDNEASKKPGSGFCGQAGQLGIELA